MSRTTKVYLVIYMIGRKSLEDLLREAIHGTDIVLRAIDSARTKCDSEDICEELHDIAFMAVGLRIKLSVLLNAITSSKNSGRKSSIFQRVVSA